MKKLIFIMFTILFIGFMSLKSIAISQEAQHIQDNLKSYNITPNGSMYIELQDGKGYYFNLYKDIKDFKLIKENNSIYLDLNNDLSIKLNDSDIDKIDITKASYKNYKSSFINLHNENIWELTKEEIGVNTELGSYIYFKLNRR
jgi:hypothetical protein